jgi:predicted nucleic acid-binding protein
VKYVIDSSVILKTALPEEGSDAAVRLMDEFSRGMHQLLAPDVFPIEIGHALARAERKKILTPPEGSQRLSEILAFLPDLHPSLPLLPRAYEIASDARIGVYDSLYLILAAQEGCDFLTADRKLFSFPHVSPFPA